MANLTREQVKEASVYLERLEHAQELLTWFRKHKDATLDLLPTDSDAPESITVDGNFARTTFEIVIADCQSKLHAFGLN